MLNRMFQNIGKGQFSHFADNYAVAIKLALWPVALGDWIKGECKKSKSESTTSVISTRSTSSHESSCLPNCSPLNVSSHLLLGLVQSASVRAYS